MIEARHISHSFGKKLVLSDVTFDIKKGEIFGIIGPNGSGKTTLLRAISGLFPIHDGEILFQNKSIKQYKRKELAKYIAVLAQEGIPHTAFTVEEVVAMGRYPWLNLFSDLKEKDISLIKEALQALDLWEKRNQSVNTLSGGERQLVSLAQSMVQEPRLLFLDEPTTYLDIGHQVAVMQQIRRWYIEKELTVVTVLHDINLAAQYCDRLLLLNQGTIQTIGSVPEVLKEKTLESVYKTKPIMIEHPIYKVPQILLH